MLSNCGAGELFESPLHSKKIKPVNAKGNQPWILTGRTDAEAEAPILWPPDVKNWLIWKNPDARKDWGGQEEKGTIEDEMVGWHHQLNGHKFKQTQGDNEGQGTLGLQRVGQDLATEHQQKQKNMMKKSWSFSSPPLELEQKRFGARQDDRFREMRPLLFYVTRLWSSLPFIFFLIGV